MLYSVIFLVNFLRTLKTILFSPDKLVDFSVSKGDKILLCCNGHFGHKWGEIAGKLKLKIEYLDVGFDKAIEKIDNLESQIKEVEAHLLNLVEFAISYFNRLKKEYSENKQRKTEIKFIV